MKINKIEWPKCPECDLTINSYRILPASLFMENQPCFEDIICPSCKKEFHIKSRVDISFETFKKEE